MTLAFLTIVLGGAWAFAQSGIEFNAAMSGLTVDPRYGASTEVGMLYEIGYDTPRDISRFVSFAVLTICFFVPQTKRVSIKRATLELIGLLCIPILVHLVGTFIINNFSFCGCGSGL